MTEIPSESDICYIDECEISKHMSRDYGRSIKGERVYLSCSGRRFKRLNLVAGLIGKEVICPIKYTCNTKSAV